jgi:4-carboxymuconolactone decarboxylase
VRLRQLDYPHLNAEQRDLAAAIASGPRGKSAGLAGPFGVWLHSPAFGQRVQAFGAYCRYGTSLAPRISELAILVCARHWNARFEWAIHAPIALQAGVAAEVVEAIRVGSTPAFEDEIAASVYAFSSELLALRKVSDATYARTRLALGEPALIELVGVLGYYGLVAMTLVAFEVEPEGVFTVKPME